MDAEKEEQEVTYQASPSSFPFDGGWLSASSVLPSSCGGRSWRSKFHHPAQFSDVRPAPFLSLFSFKLRCEVTEGANGKMIDGGVGDTGRGGRTELWAPPDGVGFDWSNRHREAVKGIAYMEAIVQPQGWDHWDKLNMRPALKALRSEAGEAMVLQDNFFIEKILPGAILRKLSAAEMSEYRRPFAEPGEGRRPMLTWPREIPIEGDPADVTAIAAAYADWLSASDVPKLFVRAEPGLLVAGGANLDFARGLPAQTEVTVAGLHFVQEDSPHEIGQAISDWMKAMGLTTNKQSAA